MTVKNVYQWLKTAGQVPDKSKVKLAVKLIEEELNELKQAIENDNPAEILDAIEDLGWVCTNCAYFYGFTLEDLQVIEENVSCSNWSKFCKNEMEAQITVDLYRTGQHPDKQGFCIECDYEKSGEFWIVKRPDGKILKSYQYFSVDKL